MWKKCKLRIFVTAEEEDNSEAMRETLDSYLQDMRIFAQDFGLYSCKDFCKNEIIGFNIRITNFRLQFFYQTTPYPV